MPRKNMGRLQKGFLHSKPYIRHILCSGCSEKPYNLEYYCTHMNNQKSSYAHVSQNV